MTMICSRSCCLSVVGMPTTGAACVPPKGREASCGDGGGAEGAPIQRAHHTRTATPNCNHSPSWLP
jgi:hypothetical protein